MLQNESYVRAAWRQDDDCSVDRFSLRPLLAVYFLTWRPTCVKDIFFLRNTEKGKCMNPRWVTEKGAFY